ncbi:MAG: ABC transporter ATP-binding protein [Anaerorhabdus sp.]
MKNIILMYIKKRKILLILITSCLAIVSLTSILPGMLIQKIVDHAIPSQDFSLLLKLSIFLLLIYLGKSILNIIVNIGFTIGSQNLISKLRKITFNKIMDSPIVFFTGKNSGYITSRINEVDNLNLLITPQVFKLVISFIEFFIVFIYLSSIHIILTLIMCIPIPLFYLVTRSTMTNYSKKIEELSEKSANLNGSVNETISGIETVKSFNKQDETVSDYNEKTDDLIKLIKKQSAIFLVGTEGISLLGSFTFVLLYISAGYLIINGNLSVGALIVFTTYIAKLYAPVQSFCSLIVTIQPAIVSLKRVDELLSKYEDYRSNTSNKTINEIKNIEFKNLCFSFDNKRSIFKNLHFDFSKGDNILIKGKNGSGKSTLIHLLLGLYTNYSGSILFNGIDIKEINEKCILSKIAIVSQKPFLFNDTIKNNILYGCTNDIDEDMYIEILEKTRLSNTLSNFKAKDQTYVGENGKQLSGGEIKKIVLARALLKNPEIYIFDETFANLDKQTREEFQNIIKNDLKDKTVILIEHNDNLEIEFNKILELNSKEL